MVSCSPGHMAILTGRQEALVCAASHASRVSGKMRGLIYNALIDRATGKPVLLCKCVFVCMGGVALITAACKLKADRCMM